MRIISGWAWSVTWLLKVFCGLTHEVTGKENIPDEPVIFMSKHQSAWETIALQTIIPPAAWVLKRELLWIPLFGWGLACVSPIAIDRKNKRSAMESVIEQGTVKFKQGRHLLLFPEGTRTAYGKKVRYKQGGAKLALATGAKIVPIAHNAGKYWKRRGLTKHPGTIKVVIGEPILTEGRDAISITEEVQSWIEGQLDSWEESQS
ncbi:MAG: lysophospholipid acyltransferase family protein [Arenicella sp.]